MNPEIDASYAACRAIARKEARNFYYAFVALPAAKRDAICAVYAFMRHADDLADDESRSYRERRSALDGWVEQWRLALAGGPTSNPIFLALRDAQRRFAIPAELLDQLVEGTATDLRISPDAGCPPTAGHPLLTYPTFADLYRYCYLVASVVGLVCIRIFGYLDPRAEALAEQTGIAFQLTNILRDVREDGARGRLYLPLEDLERCGISPGEMIGTSPQWTANRRQVLRIQAERAHTYYQAAGELLPLLTPDSRPAMWVLVTIYRRLLRHIERRNFEVFSTKIRVPTHEKLAILGWGVVKTLF